MDPERAREAVATAERLGREVVGPAADAVDAEARFPTEAVAALREGGLLGLLVPRRLGGLGGDIDTFHRIASVLGGHCLSTALVWAMHGQQVAVLAEHGGEALEEHLAAVARHGLLVASITSEHGKGGDLLTARAPLEPTAAGWRLRREAPTVSYGAEAGLFLVTMRGGPDRPPGDVRLVLVTPADGELRVLGPWRAMGMRGTASVPMELDVELPAHRRLATPLRTIALRTMVPVGHLGWSAAWYGAARGALDRFVAQLRGAAASGGRDPRSELLQHRLAELRLSLDLVEALLLRVAGELETLRRAGADGAFDDLGWQIRVNNLKVAAAQRSYAVVDALVEMAGLGRGYLQHGPLGLERVFRDLRSAALMFHNDRLLAANGRLLLVEGTRLAEVWRSPDAAAATSGEALPQDAAVAAGQDAREGG